VNARTVACVAAVITGLAVGYTVALLLAMPDPDWAYLARGVIHVGGPERMTRLDMGRHLAAALGVDPDREHR